MAKLSLCLVFGLVGGYQMQASTNLDFFFSFTHRRQFYAVTCGKVRTSSLSANLDPIDVKLVRHALSFMQVVVPPVCRGTPRL